MSIEPGSNEPSEAPFGMFGDVPLFREIQRVLMSSTGPINWELARQVGIAVAMWDSEDSPPSEEDRQGLADTVRAAELAVADFTGLPSPTDVAPVEAIRRAEWVEANCRGLRELLDPVAERMNRALAEAQGGPLMPGLPGMGDPGEGGPNAELLQAMLSQMTPLLMGAQVGSVLGFLGQRLLGQFDLAVPRAAGSLYFVVPNIKRFEADWKLPSMEFRAFVALHEVTHRFEFARPWVRDHFLGLVKDMVEHAEFDVAGLQRRLEEMDVSSPEALSEALEGAGSLFGEASDPEQRLRIARVQAFMTAAEGYGDHVMEALGKRMLPSYPRIEEALARYRDGRHGDEALERLIGLEMKDEQYRLGRAFCARVVEQTDEATLARMWDSPDALPSMPEIEEPTLWLSRIV